MEHPVVISSRGITFVESPIAKYITSAAGRNALAQAMIAPIRRNLNYAGIARRCLQVTPMPQGALSAYDRDIDIADWNNVREDVPSGYQHNAITINSHGKCGDSIKSFLPPFHRVKFPLFEIAANPTIRLADIKTRRRDLYDRGIQVNRQPVVSFQHNIITINSYGKVRTHRQNRRFTVMDRAVQKARQEIMAQEDANIFAVLDNLDK